MKNSGIPWIGEIPSHWQVFQTSTLFHEHKEKNLGEKEKNLLSLSYGQIKRKDINSSEGLLPQSFETYNVVQGGDIIFRLTDLQNDKRSLRTGLCKEKGIITSAYVSIRANTDVDSRYFHYLYHSYDICKVFYGMGDGVRQGMNYDDLRKLLVLLPPIPEQQSIADFLDKKCREIDEMVSLQEKIIEELKAFKQSVITEVVCRGLNPDVPMKDSGIEWIGLIPNEWEARIGKKLYLANDGGVWGEEPMGSGDTAVLRSTEQDIDGRLMIESPAYRHLSAREIASATLQEGDLIITKSSGSPAHIGKTSIIDAKTAAMPCCFSNFIQRIRVNGFPKYYWYAFNSYPTKKQFDYLSTTTTGINNINSSTIDNVFFAVPPIKEQQAIADYLDEKCGEIDALIAVKQSKIDALREYKKSIIYEYITGKREVL